VDGSLTSAGRTRISDVCAGASPNDDGGRQRERGDHKAEVDPSLPTMSGSRVSHMLTPKNKALCSAGVNFSLSP
jgi:hypothetical protein